VARETPPTERTDSELEGDFQQENAFSSPFDATTNMTARRVSDRKDPRRAREDGTL
jgi:hypothetical protein